MPNPKHLIGIEVCDYFEMQTNVGILIEVYNVRKVCGHMASFRADGTVTWAAGAERQKGESRAVISVEEKQHFAKCKVTCTSECL